MGFEDLVKKLASKQDYQELYSSKFSDREIYTDDKEYTNHFLKFCSAIIKKKIKEKNKKQKDKDNDTTEFIDDKKYYDKQFWDKKDSLPEEIIGGGTLSATRIKTPKVFTITYKQFWTPIIQQEIDMYRSGKTRNKGFLFYIEGKGKTGKTHFAQSSVEFKGYKSKYRTVPRGPPVFIIEADGANRDETETKWYKYLPSDVNPEGLIHIANCYVESPETEFIDPEATLEKMYAGIFSLRYMKYGTLIIDPYSLLCDLILFVYLLKHKDKFGEFDIEFSEFLEPSRKIPPTEHQYKKKLVYELLRKLRMFMINIILIGNVKPVYKQDDEAEGIKRKSIYSMKKTNEYESDVQRGTEYWVDVIGRFYKQPHTITAKTKDGNIVRKNIVKRHLAITDCRFENKELDVSKYTFEAPTFSEIVNYLMEVYPK